jgi:hypothetical protein
MDAMQAVVLLLVVLVIVALIAARSPYFSAVFEHRDRDAIIDNKVVTPPEGSSPLEETIKQAEEAGEIDEEGLAGR